jgi:UPF0755 protein
MRIPGIHFRLRSLTREWSARTAAALAGAVVVILVAVFVVLFVPAIGDGVPREVTIEPGMSGSRVARLLKDEGVIRSATAFRWYAAVTGRSDRLQAGRYVLCPCDSLGVTLDAIASGRALSDDIVLTVPEGMNVWEIDRLVAGAGLEEEGIFRRANRVYEGTLFPDTYRFREDINAVDIAERMRQEFGERASGYTPEQVIVASMLEKEAKTSHDMALVAGIIYKRMEIGMLLQIDATVAYGWCLRSAGLGRDCDVTQAPIALELGIDGPYNTYLRAGLPAGPISNPGIQALEAAANPSTSDYLFYLSTRDGSRIIYAETHEEHLQNRREHLGF